jgi:hypothetical protein
MQDNPERDRHGDVSVADATEVERLVAEYPASEYVEAVVELAERSERTYAAAVNAGHVVYGFSDSTNY